MTEVDRIEGIRRVRGGWAVIGSRRGQSVVPGRSPRIVTLVTEFTGPGSKIRAIESAGSNRIAPPDSEIRCSS
jgi:hypothetical protein